MELLIILGLGVWVLLLGQRVGALQRQVEWLQRSVEDLRAEQTPPTPQPAPAPTWEAPEPANEALPELLLTEKIEEPEPEAAQPELILTQVAPPEPVAPPLPPRPEPARAAPKAKQDRAFEKWLSENGFAWLGGAALALGGAFLVAFAAQQGLFTPLMRLAAAIVVGGAMIGASEWVRRESRKRSFGHPLVAALLAGAGAATLYATAWGAHGLYHYIDWPVAAFALAVCAAILLRLSFLHGQALGALAIVAALLAPPLTSAGAWPAPALTLYLGAAGATGFAVAALRRWGWVAATTTLGAYVWFALSLTDGALYRALFMLSLAAIGACALGFRRAEAAQSSDPLDWPNIRAMLPTLAIAISALAAVAVWDVLAWRGAAPASIAGPALVGLLHVALAAFALRARVAHEAALVAAIGGLVLGAYAFTRVGGGGADGYLWLLVCAPATGLAALATLSHARERILVSAFGAVGALLLLLVALAARPHWNAFDVWGPLAAGAVLLALAGEIASRQSTSPRADWSVDAWAGAGAVALILALESAIPSTFKTPALAGAALGFTAVHIWRGWRAASASALSAAALTLAHALSPSFLGEAWRGATNVWQAEAILVLAAALLFAAAFALRRAGPRTATAEALESASILVLLIGAFLLLRHFAAAGERLDYFTETALRALTLVAAGFVVLPRGDAPVGFITRWRGHALMAAGLAVALLTCGLVYHPWWGVSPASLAIPLINANALAFAAPAALALLTAGRFYLRERALARAYAIVGAIFAACWAALEIRRAFHGPMMAGGPIGLVEGDCYGLAALAGACAVVLWARQRAGQAAGDDRRFTHDLIRVTGAATFAGVLIGALFLLATRNAWWGGQDFHATNASATALATLAHVPAAVLAMLTGLALPKRASNACFAAASAAALFAMTFGLLAIRWAHHQGAMDDFTSMRGIEGLYYTLWPLAFISAAIWATERLANDPSGRELARDFDAIWAIGLWPALAYAAFGLWALFNPWRGAWPAQADSFAAAAIGLGLYLAAAALSFNAARLPIMRETPYFATAAKIAGVVHLFAATTLIVRRIFHGPDMASEMMETSLETWTYSAVWALFGAATLAIGALRRDGVLRWVGLALLLAVTAKVFLVDMARLNGVVRAASFLGLGGVLVLVALATRRFGQTPRTN
jgi:uncharacterized membrane protein